MKKKNTSGSNNWQRIALSVLCVFLAFLLFVMIFVTAFVERALGSILIGGGPNDTLPPGALTKPTLPSDFTGVTIPPESIPIPTAPKDFLRHEKLVNIMLVGQDRRPEENYRTRSDSMILCTFNLQDNSLTMTSFMRDMYVEIPGHGGSKMNAAYQWGGMPLLSETMALNFGVHVDAFVEVDFSGFEAVINALGGIDVPLSATEAKYMNKNTGWSLTEGINHLNGKQALSYSRIRMVPTIDGTTDDFGRTERQRRVLTIVLNNCKDLNLSSAYALVNELIPIVKTDMTRDEVFNYFLTLFPMLVSTELNTQRIPIDGSYKFAWVGSLDVVLPDLELNRQYLYDTLMPE